MIINNLIKSNNSKLCSLTQTEKQKASDDFLHKQITSVSLNNNPLACINRSLISFGKKLSSQKLAKIKAYQDEILASLKDELTPEQYTKAKEIAFIAGRGDKQFDEYGIVNLSALSNAEFAKAKERGLFYIEARGDKQFNPNDIFFLAKLSDTKFAKAKELLYIEARGTKQFDGYEIAYLSTLSDAEFAKAKGLFYIEGRGDKQFDTGDIIYLSKLSDAEFAKAKELLYIEGRGDKQFDTGDIIYLSRLSEAEFAKAKERGLFYIEARGDKQFGVYAIADLAKLSDAEFAKAKERGLFYIEARGDKQFGVCDIAGLAKLSDAEFNKISKHLGNPNLYFYDFEQMAKYSPQNIENYVLLIDKGFYKKIADKIIQSIPVKTSKPVKTSAKPQAKYNIIEAQLKKSNLEFTDKMGVDADNLSKVIKNPLFSQHLALINNLSVEQVMDIYGDKLKRQISGFITKLSIDQKSALKNDGIDTDSLIQKLNAKSDAPIIKQPKVKQARTKQSLPEIEKQIIDKFNVPQEIYQDINKFNDFCKSKFEELINTEYPAKGFYNSEKITQKRTDILNNWKKLFDEEDMDYKSRLLITSTITKDLDVGNKSTPLQPSIQVANEIINAIDQGKNVSKALAKNATDGMIFSKVNIDGIEGEWIRIPSKKHDPENFADNVNKLKALSLPNWCTHTFNAEPYLSKGDFYVFRSNGKTELGVRFAGDIIQEIQGFMNDRTIPLPFANIAKEFVESNNFKATSRTISDIARSVSAKPEFDLLQAEVEQLLKDKNYKGAFEKLGIKALGERNGKLIIQTNELNSDLYRMQDFIGGNELWEQVCEVLDLNIDKVNTIRNLDTIYGQKIPWELLK